MTESNADNFVSFTAHRPHWEDYDLTNPATEVRLCVERAIRVFFPHLRPDSYDARVRVHLSEHSCNNEETLYRLPLFLTVDAVKLRGKKLCLHDFGPSSSSQPSIQRAQTNVRGDGTPGPATGGDEHEEEDGGNNNSHKDADEKKTHTDVNNEGGRKHKNGDYNEVVRSGGGGNRAKENEEDNLQIILKLEYDLEGLPHLNDRWGSRRIAITNPKASLQGVLDEVADRVAAKLKNRNPNCYATLDEEKRKAFALLRPLLQTDCPMKRWAFDGDKSGVARVLGIEDLLRDEPKEDETLSELKSSPQLTVKLQLVDTVRRVADDDPAVVIRCGAKDLRSGELTFYWVGSKPDKNQAIEANAIETSDAYFWRLNTTKTKIVLVAAPMWSIRDVIVCDPDEAVPIAGNKQQLKASEIDDPATEETLVEAISSGEIHPWTEGRLLYTFKTWKQSESPIHELHAFLPDDATVTVALRFVHHLESKEAKKLNFSATNELLLDAKDDYHSICEEVTEGLKTPGDHPDAAALFKKPLKDSWSIELWILPQLPNIGGFPDEGRTMYKFDENSELFAFLDSELVEDGDLTLFGEVHIVPNAVPRVDEDKPTISARDARAASKPSARS